MNHTILTISSMKPGDIHEGFIVFTFQLDKKKVVDALLKMDIDTTNDDSERALQYHINENLDAFLEVYADTNTKDVVLKYCFVDETENTLNFIGQWGVLLDRQQILFMIKETGSILQYFPSQVHTLRFMPALHGGELHGQYA